MVRETEIMQTHGTLPVGESTGNEIRSDTQQKDEDVSYFDVHVDKANR
jgi:hypothetical protein